MSYNEAEEKWVDFYKQRGGGFFTKLLSAIQVADFENRELLKKAYPELVEVYLKMYTDNDYSKDIESRL